MVFMPVQEAKRDDNFIPSLLGVDSVGFTLPTTVAVDPTTHAMLVSATITPSGTQDVNLIKVGGSSFALGQALATASLPIVLTAAQLSTLTPPAAITGFATEITLGTRLSETDFDTKTGSLTEAAPATDTASSGLNGRLQRIAQRITALITTLGSPFQAGGSIGNTSFTATQATGTNLHVVVDSAPSTAVTGPLTDTQLRATAVPVSGTVNPQRGTTTTSSNVAGSATFVTLIAANSNRVKATIYNDSTALLYVKEGDTASVTSFDYLLNPATATSAGGLVIIDDYTGLITGIWASATGNARVGETV